jgi:hypothetical protein
VYARRLSEILGSRWEQIPLGDFHKYFEDWEKLFGVSTHAHGMYHLEFYNKILPKVERGNPFLSGIIGDAWAGNVNIPVLKRCVDVKRLGYTHGLQADSVQNMLPAEQSLLSGYWEIQKFRLEDIRFCVVEAMRFKLILLCYLKIAPRIFGFQWWSPFLDIDIAMAMLNLPTAHRRRRLWQKEFFQKVGLDLESLNLQATHQNTLNLQGQNRSPVKPLDVNLLRQVIRPDYVDWINQNIVNCQSNLKDKVLSRLLRVRKVGGALRRLGLTDNARRQIAAYNAYLVLLPIENMLRRRNQV